MIESGKRGYRNDRNDSNDDNNNTRNDDGDDDAVSASVSVDEFGDYLKSVPEASVGYNDVWMGLNAVANLSATKMMAPGILNREVHLHAAKVIATRLKELGLMKGNIDDAVASGAHALFMPHGLGHMMGLDVHDMESFGEDLVGYNDEIKRSSQFGTAYLRLGRKLETGFVITNEPGIYFIPALIDKWKAEKINSEFINFDKVETYKDFGGIRLEDDILITDKGARVLGKAIPKTVAEVEDIMS